MKQYLKVAFILFAICAVSAILLAAVNQITAPYIAYNTMQTTAAALDAVSGGYTQGEHLEGNGDNINYIVPLYDGDELAGYILELSTSGYGGEIVMAASYRLDGTVISSKVMSDDETPGLGKNAEESWYMAMFEGLGGEGRPLPESKNDLADPSVVSGASVTFAGVSSAIRSGSEYVKSLGR